MKFGTSCPYVHIVGMKVKTSALNTPFNVNTSTRFVLSDMVVTSGNAFESKGSATIAQGSTTVVVTHGISHDSRNTRYWDYTGWIMYLVDIKHTSTQFTINIASAAPAVGITFGWHCKLY